MRRQFYRIRLDRHLPRGRVASSLVQQPFTEFTQARVEAARLQRDFDAEAEPVTVYVVGRDGIPRWRAGASECSEADQEEAESASDLEPATAGRVY